MPNKVLAWLWIASLAVAGLGGAFGADSDDFYAVVGIAMFVFGIWGAIRLMKTEA